MNHKIPFALHSIGQDEIDEVVDTLKSDWITTGPKTKLFEESFAEYLGVKHAIAVNSCTSALHLALETLGVTNHDYVITSPFSFTATAETIRYLGAEPLFVDINEKTFNIEPDSIRQVIENSDFDLKRIKAIMPVHYGGQSCDMDPIRELAGQYDLKIIDDAAHAFPTKYKGQFIGKIADLTCFSFYATKTITTAEGGMVVTDSDMYSDRMKIMRLHGISKDAFKRYSDIGADWFYEVVAPGYKYNMPDIAAAIGLHQLRKSDKFRQQRQFIAEQYNNGFKNIAEIEPPYLKEASKNHAWHLYVIKLKLKQLKIDRAEFIHQMKQQGIGTSVHFIPIHLHPYYRDRYGLKPEDFPVSYKIFQQVISLPIYPRLKQNDIDRVINTVKSIIAQNKK